MILTLISILIVKKSKWEFNLDIRTKEHKGGCAWKIISAGH